MRQALRGGGGQVDGHAQAAGAGSHRSKVDAGLAVALHGIASTTSEQQGVVAHTCGLVGDVAQLVVLEIAKVKGVVVRRVAQNAHVGEGVSACNLCISARSGTVGHCSSAPV